MKKKLLLSVLGVVMAAGLVTGCGSKGETADTQQTEAAAEDKSESATGSGEEAEASDKDASAKEAESSDETASAKEEGSSDETASAEAEESSDEAASTEEVGSSTEETGAQTESVEEYVFTNTDPVSVAGWTITVEDVEKNASLENVSVQLGYTGVETSDYQKEAESGKTFCLIKMAIKKDGSKETFKWENLKLTDGAGNEYARMEDEFLTDLGMTRMPGTALNFGSNEGWIAFEIDENAENLVLNYPFESETYSCELK